MAAIAAHAGLSAHQQALLQSALQIQGWQAPALLATAIWSAMTGSRLAILAGLAFAAGTLAFCLPVYLLAFTGAHLGPMAPAGGFTLMAGWLLLGLSAIGGRRR